MTRNIKTISTLLPPPSDPVGLDRSWEEVEQELGTNLPSDYKEFIDLYGTGQICELVVIWNFRDASFFGRPLPDFLWGSEGTIQWYEKIRAAGGHDWPYAMFPTPGGILPFATVVDVHHLNWLTKGQPNKWDVAFWFSDGQEFVHLKGDSFGKCLLKILRKSYKNDALQLDPPFEFSRFPSS